VQTKRQGFRDPTIGIAWAPVNEARELQLDPKIYPRGGGPSTWVVGADLTLGLPISVDDPSHFGAAASPSAPDSNTVARRTHVLTVWTAFSKRFQVAEPYMRLSGSVPFARKDAYDNCSHPELLSDVAPANCAGAWKGETGYNPGVEAALTLGTELVLLESPYGDARFALDVRGDARYHGAGRDYTQVTDALGKLTYRDEYMTLGSSVGAYARVGSSFRLGVYATAGFDTAHTLTHEDLGAEKDSVPGVQVSGGSGQPAPDQNPDFDYRLDPAGRRLHAEANFIWGLSGQLAVIF
jgi:hypothetical protein